MVFFMRQDHMIGVVRFIDASLYISLSLSLSPSLPLSLSLSLCVSER